jgi:hypothetical protein
MYELTTAAMIWNRACGDDPLRALPGDRALADVLYAHGLAMNGGVLYAVECMTVEEQCDAEAGYRYYGLDGIATLLTRAREIFEAANDLGDYEQQLNLDYVRLIPSDSSLVERFESQLKSRPYDFGAVPAKDRG